MTCCFMPVLRLCSRSPTIPGILVPRLASSAYCTPGTSDCNIILTSTACSPPAVSLRITLAGSPHADPSFFPSRYSAASSAASSSPVSAGLSLQARSSSTADFCPWLSHAHLLPGCESCSATTGSSIPSGLSEDRNTRCAISERIHIAWLSPTAGWSLHREEARQEQSGQNADDGKQVFPADKLGDNPQENKKERSHQKAQLGMEGEQARALSSHVGRARQIGQGNAKYQNRQQAAAAGVA